MWGHDIDNFLKNSQRLIPLHYNRIVQRLCDLVYNITPEPSKISELVGVLEKNPEMTFVNGTGYKDVKDTGNSIFFMLDLLT